MGRHVGGFCQTGHHARCRGFVAQQVGGGMWCLCDNRCHGPRHPDDLYVDDTFNAYPEGEGRDPESKTIEELYADWQERMESLRVPAARR